MMGMEQSPNEFCRIILDPMDALSSSLCIGKIARVQTTLYKEKKVEHDKEEPPMG